MNLVSIKPENQLDDGVPLKPASLRRLVDRVAECTCWNFHTHARHAICTRYKSLQTHAQALKDLDARHRALGYLPEDGPQVRSAADAAIRAFHLENGLAAQLDELWAVL